MHKHLVFIYCQKYGALVSECSLTSNDCSLTERHKGDIIGWKIQWKSCISRFYFWFNYQLSSCESCRTVLRVSLRTYHGDCFYNAKCLINCCHVMEKYCMGDWFPSALILQHKGYEHENTNFCLRAAYFITSTSYY